MKFIQNCWLAFVHLFNDLGSPWNDVSTPQQHLVGGLDDLHSPGRGPRFGAPNSPVEDQFICDYSAMGSHWVPCSTEDERGCWLKDTLHGNDFNISTNYENRWPNGTTRSYTLDVSEMPVNLDGVTMPYGKVFNRTYPGPWIQACWGDDVEITVTNNLRKYNGTTVHWHGIRQLNSFQNDGVNGVTQCPIPPGSSFTYSFKITQYGSTWYHSHYALQYADGLVGPMTLYGPSSANYDLAIEPTLITDWNHNSAFTDFSRSQFVKNSGPVNMDSILLNGIGNYAGVSCGGRKYSISFVQGKRYLMRLINTSVDTTFVFSIDGHDIWVMSSDFVPIKPYKTDHVVIGIGQRYHVVVVAKTFEVGHPLREENYWIRTIPATGCAKFSRGNIPDERQGILRYDSRSDVIPTTARGDFDITCSDEPYEKLIPIFKWTVGDPANSIDNDSTEVGLMGPTHEQPYLYGLFRRWAIGTEPLWVNFSDPTILNMQKKGKWDPNKVVIPENFGDDSWVYLLITGNQTNPKDPGRAFVPAAHPMHLHGHDFALLQQSKEPYAGNGSLHLKRDNPPRRDVVLLPLNGFIVIAFKTDNPGAWLLHCHIAWHASSGLAMQILERAPDVKSPRFPFGWPDAVETGCRDWRKWYSDPGNLWDSNYTYFQDDSGI